MLTYTSIHILVTEMLKSEPVEPTDTIELKPYVKFVVEPKENQGKQLSMISFSYLLCLGIYGLCIMFIHRIVVPIFMHYPSLNCLSISLSQDSWITN